MNTDQQSRTGTTLVRAAQAGDRHAREALAATWLPLVYNVAGRALNGHADVDDVAQETMIRALDGLDGLRDPAAFRSWLIAITMNQIRRRATGQQQAAVGGLDESWELADPGADFTDLTILRLGLSGQRREVARATRWLDPDDRTLLSLWWLEACGELTRAELAEALGLSPQHTAVRVQRMKKQLDAGRVVVRALAAHPRCPGLAELVAGWDGVPGSVWRKRTVRHIRGCVACDALGRDLLPAEGLLAGLALVPVPTVDAGLPIDPQSAASTVPDGNAHGPTTPDVGPPDGNAHGPTMPDVGAPGSGSSGPSGPFGGSGLRRAALACGAAALLALGTFVLLRPHQPPHEPGASEQAGAAAVPDAPSAESAAPTAATPTPTVTPGPSGASAASAPSPAGSRPAAPPSPERQLVDLVNAQRARAGCGPLRVDPRLHAAAQKHAEDMVARRFFAHADPDGVRAGTRLTAAGYRWSQWGENLDLGPGAASGVFAHWMDGGIHQSNMLDCAFKDVGVGVATGPAGHYWTQDLAAEAGG